MSGEQGSRDELPRFETIALKENGSSITVPEDRVHCSRRSRDPRRARRGTRLLTAVVAVFSSVAVILLFRSHVITDAVHRLEGHVLIVEEPSRELRVPAAGGEVQVTFPIRNVSGTTITVFDAEACCGDAVLSKLPLAILPGRQSEIVFRVTAPADGEPPAVRTMRLFVDTASPPIVLQAHITVAPSAGRGSYPSDRSGGPFQR